ncbi:MAG: zinc metallopeptidase [Clostridia bacterium]|nr:zinc metallopeptidase [Clostridia bacterium]
MVYVLFSVLILFLLLALAIAGFSGSQLEETFNKYNRIPCNRKITGGEFALSIANNNLDGRIKVFRTGGYLKDAYSTRSKAVVLSDSTCDVSSVAALTVVAHEFGHAMQDLNDSRKFKLNRALTKVIRFIGFFMLPLAFLGIFICLISSDVVLGFCLLGASLLIFLLAIILKIMSIPLEKDASKRGLKLLEETGTFDEDELMMAKDLLKAALLTYVGDFLRSILWWTFLTKNTKLF